MNSTERVLRGVLHRDDPAWERWLKYEILANQVNIMKAMEDLQKAIARVTDAADLLHAKHVDLRVEHGDCPKPGELQEAADALQRVADKLSGAIEGAEQTVVPAVPAASA